MSLASAERSLPSLTWLNCLGRSAHGEAWRAVDGTGNVLVAKRVAVASAEQRRRLSGRLRALQQLRDIRLVPVDDVISVGDHVWLLRAYDAGASWERLGRMASPSATQVAVLAHALVDELAELHRCDFGHGGLRPSNVFVERDGAVWLTDAAANPAVGGVRRVQRDDLAALPALLETIWRPGRRAEAPAMAALLAGELARARSADAALLLLAEAIAQGPVPDEQCVAGIGAMAARITPAAETSLPNEILRPIVADDMPSASARGAAARAALTTALAESRTRRLRRRLTLLAGAVCVAAAAAVVLLHVLAH